MSESFRQYLQGPWAICVPVEQCALTGDFGLVEWLIEDGQKFSEHAITWSKTQEIKDYLLLAKSARPNQYTGEIIIYNPKHRYSQYMRKYMDEFKTPEDVSISYGELIEARRLGLIPSDAEYYLDITTTSSQEEVQEE